MFSQPQTRESGGESQRKAHGRKFRCQGSYWAYVPDPLPLTRT